LNTKSDIKVETADKVQLSSTPIKGRFKVKCVNNKGGVSFSGPINVLHIDGFWIKRQIENHCYQLRDKLEVHLSNKDVTNQYAGRGFYIGFKGYNDDPGQFSVVSDEEQPLVGKDLKFHAETVLPYGTNLFFEPIPFEMLKTYETKPQLIVSVNGLPAVCHSLKCDF